MNPAIQLTATDVEEVVLVDEQDHQVGYAEKVEAHLGQGTLHRAFTVLVFDSKGRTLIAKRSAEKMLWPRIWDSACASHPRHGESYEDAGERRLTEELGFTCKLTTTDKFTYHATWGTVGSERELCATLVGFYEGEIEVDESEVADWQWINMEQLLWDFEENPDSYAPWFIIAVERMLADGTLSLGKDGRVTVLPEQDVSGILERTPSLVDPIMMRLVTDGVRESDAEPFLHQINAGGKRIRPALTLISSMLFGGPVDEALVAGASLEIMHNATLIADDIIDRSTFRRGKPTLWKRYGNSFAECAVLTYCATVFGALRETSHAESLAPLYSETLRTVVNGELLDILFERSGRADEGYVTENRLEHLTVEDYSEMAYNKTAALIEAACVAGGIVANAPDSQLAALAHYGKYLGLAFQVRDDILDVFGDESKFGKQIGRDIYERKAGNVVLLTALDHMSPTSRQRCVDLFCADEISPEDVESIMKLVRKTDALKLATRLAGDFADEARLGLAMLPNNRWRAALEQLVTVVVHREV